MEFGNTDFLKNNRRFLGPIVLFVLAAFIILRVIIPMISSISEERTRLTDSQARLEKLNSSQNAIQEINADNIVDNIELTKKALPINKEIIQIYTTVVDVAARNSIDLSSFSVKVGQVYNKDGLIDAASDKDSQSQEFPTLDISVDVEARDTDSLFKFSNDLMKVLPLANVNNFSTSQTNGQYDISFYYKPLNTGALAQQEFVTPLNDTEKQSLQTIEEFDQN